MLRRRMADAVGDMTDVPAVRCAACDYTWRSAAMVEGLRLLGACPRCSGALRFRDEVPAPDAATAEPAPPAAPPHMVLGVPRR